MKPIVVIINFLLRLLIFSGILAVCHSLLIHYTGLQLTDQYLVGFQVFLVVLTWLSYSFVYWVVRVSYAHAGFSYIGAILLKMMASVVFLMPLIKAHTPLAKSAILQFLVLYLFFLVFEAMAVYKLLKKYASNN